MASSDHRIIDISFDEQSIAQRSPAVERERAIAIHDLIEQNLFRPCAQQWSKEMQQKTREKSPKDESGPFRLRLSIIESRLYFAIANEKGQAIGSIMMSLAPFRRIVRDYFQICESYFDAVKRHSPTTIETIDAARRGVHDEGAVLLSEQLGGKIELDHPTARRLFTLIAVLYLRL